MKPFLLPLCVASALAFLGAGCLGLSPKPDPTRYFVLASLSAQAAPEGKSARVAIHRVRIPSYLQKRWLATREGNEIHYAADDEWAESLPQGIQRVLEANLSALLGPVPLNPERKSAGTAFELLLTIEQFEVNTAGDAMLSAQWEILPAEGVAPLRAGQFHRVRSDAAAAGNPAIAVQLQSELLADLSQAVVEAVRALTPP
jgi:uncharacterized lipoprotein YmbA